MKMSKKQQRARYPVDDRPIVLGGKYQARLVGKEEYENVTAVELMGSTLGFVADGYPNFNIQTTYYDDVINADGSELSP